MLHNLGNAFRASAVATAILLSGCGSETYEDHMKNAQSYVETSEFKSGVLALKKAVIANPESIEARHMLAKVYLDMNKYREAEKELQKVIELGKTSPDVFADMAEIKFETKKYSEAYIYASRDFSTDKDSQLKATFFAVLASIQDGKVEKVGKYIKKLGALGATSEYTKTAQAWAALATNDFEESREHVNEALKVNADFSHAIFISGRLHDISGEVSQARDDYQRYVSLKPYDVDKQIYLYQALMALGDVEQAEKVVDAIYQTHAKHPLVNLYKAQISYEKSEYAKASEFAKKVLTTFDKHLPASLIVGASAYQMGSYKEAFDVLKPYESKLKDGSVKKMLMLTKLKLGMAVDVAKDIESSDLNEHIDLDILLVTSMNLSRSGEQEKAIALLEQNGSEESAKILAQRGLAMLSMNDAEGIALLERSIELDSELEGAKLALAMAHLKTGNTAGAIKIANEWQNKTETKTLGQLLNANIYTQQGKHTQAKEIYTQILSVDGTNVAALYGSAQYLEMDGQLKQAVSIYKKVVTSYPGHVDALSRITEINQKAGQISETLAFLNPLLQTNEDNIKLRLNIAYNEFLTGNAKKAIETLKSVDVDATTPDVYYVVLGDSYMVTGMQGQGIKAFQTLTKKNPANFIAQMRYISALEFDKRYVAALHAVKNAKTIFKGNEQLSLLEIRYELFNRDAGSALKNIAELKKVSEKKTKLVAYEAEAYFIKEEYLKSASLFELVLQAEPNKVHKLGAAKAYSQGGKPQKAIDLLESMIKDSETDLQVLSMLGELYYGIDKDKSLYFFEKAVTQHPKDVFLNNNAGMLSLELGQAEKALKYSEVAYRLNSSFTAVNNTYGSALVENKMYEKAIVTLKKSVEMGSKNVSALIYLAEAYDKLGKFPDEVKTLKKALKLSPTPEQLDIIESMVEQAL